jgi:hypothetical protein
MGIMTMQFKTSDHYTRPPHSNPASHHVQEHNGYPRDGDITPHDTDNVNVWEISWTFWGKTVVFSGDFKQVIPIVR